MPKAQPGAEQQQEQAAAAAAAAAATAPATPAVSGSVTSASSSGAPATPATPAAAPAPRKAASEADHWIDDRGRDGGADADRLTPRLSGEQQVAGAGVCAAADEAQLQHAVRHQLPPAAGTVPPQLQLRARCLLQVLAAGDHAAQVC